MNESVINWPRDAAIVVSINVAWENWLNGAIPDGRVDIPLIPPVWRERGVPDLVFESWQSYANGPGMARLQDLLDRHEVRASGLFNALAVERHPDVARRWAAAGHEVVGHGYQQETRNYTLSREDEAAMVATCRATLERDSGASVTGWISPGGQPSAATVDILIEQGFRYSMDFAHDDVPTVVIRPGGAIVAIPHQFDIHDIATYARFRHSPDVYVDYFRWKFDTLYAEGLRGSPKLLTASVHAHLFGHPFGSGALEACINYARKHPRVWFATKSEVAEVAAAQLVPAT